MIAKRREIMRRQRVDDDYMASWFAFKPVSKPAPKKFAACSYALQSRPALTAIGAHSILGTRGIPANYGGFETFAEELSVRLAARGHEVRSIAASVTSFRSTAA